MKQRSFFLNKLLAIVMMLGMIAPIFAVVPDTKNEKKKLTEDQKIMHVLNRLGFGARPGDVEKVKAMGLQKYIDQQLNGDSINDSAAESKVKNLEIFNMSTAEAFAKYPNPGALLRQLEGDKRKQAAVAVGEGKDADAKMSAGQTAEADQRARREKLSGIYKEYNLKPAAQMAPQIAANRVLRAVYSERQLQEVMVDFWQNHFNVYSGKNSIRWYIPSYERDVLRKNALGNFKDLLVATAQHPAMLAFLDNFQSVSPNAQTAAKGKGNNRLQNQLKNGNLSPVARERIKERRGLTDSQLDQRIKQATNKKPAVKRGINENYARELMELHTLGVDGGYTQKDIVEVAKAFTGWTIADPTGYRRAAASTIQGTEEQRLIKQQRQQGVPDGVDSGEFYFNARWHDKDPKMVLGKKIDEGGINDGLKVLDILVNEPATAKFIARKLAVKFVSDTPSEGFVGRIADAFHRSKGDIKTTLSAIFNDKEFFAPENYRAKIKTPFELAISSVRTLGADTNGGPQFVAMLNKLGEVPYGYQAPTGYPDMAEDWVNTGALLERLNFAVAVASNRIPGTNVDLKNYDGQSKVQILDRAIADILDNDISAMTKTTLLKQIEKPLPEVQAAKEIDDSETMTKGKGARQARLSRLKEPAGNPEVFKVVSLVLGSPEFQRQ